MAKVSLRLKPAWWTRPLREAAKLAGVYLILGAAWILASDTLLLRLSTELTFLSRWQMFKGWLFVAASALVLFLVVARHLSVRQHAEEALHKNEQRYRELFEQAHDAVYTHDLEGNLTSINRAGRSLSGYQHDQLVGMNISRFVPPEQVETARRLIADYVAGNNPPPQELDILTKDGRRLTLEVNARLIRDNGRPVAVQGIARDITERKRSEEALRASEARYHALFEESPIALWIEDFSGPRRQLQELRRLGVEDFAGYLEANPEEVARLARMVRVVDVNRKAVEFFEAPSKAALLKELRSVLGELAYATFRTELLALASHQRRWQGETPGRTLTGKLRYILVQWSVAPGYEDSYQRVIVSTLDITEQRQAETAEREANEKLRAVIQASPAAIVALDTAGRVTMWNLAAERLFGWSQEEALGLPLPFLSSQQEEESRVLQERVLCGDPFTEMELRRQRRDGSYIDVSLSTAPLFDSHHQVVGLIGVMTDITARKRLEEQFRQAQKMEAVGRLAGGLAHDLNNILMITKGYGELLSDRLASEPRLRSMAGEIQDAADRAAGLIRQLLAFSRKQVIQPVVLDLNQVVTGMDTMIRPLLEEDIEFHTELEADLGRVKADPGQMEQILLNLAVNARDAMASGGRLTLKTANVEMDEAFVQAHLGARPGSYVTLSVSDTGGGMNEETRSHIFEPFFTTKEKGKGTGLGLATVYGIVKQSDGYITVDSAPGRGTTFQVYLPRVQAEVEKAMVRPAPGRHTAPLSRQRQTVLVAEDQPSLRAVMREYLETLGFEVLEAGSGDEARDLLESQSAPVALLITDVVMPGMSGPLLAEHVASLNPAAKVLYVSGYPDETIARHGILEPGTNFLQKPFTLEALREKLSGMMTL